MNTLLACVSGICLMPVFGLAGADRAAASSCPIDGSSPTAEFSVNTYVFGYNGTPVCGTLDELPIADTYAGGGEHYMECASKIERPGEILQETYATGNGFGSNNHIVHSAWIHLGDVVISGGPGPTVDGTLNLLYGGDQISCAAANPARCYTGEDFWVRVNGGGYYTFDYVWGIYETGSVPLTGLPVGTPFNLNIQMQQLNEALAFTTGSQRWNGFVQFLPSQVFNLPAGYTVNSVDGNIVDNQWPPGIPTPNLSGAVSRKSCDLALDLSGASRTSEPRQGGITEVCFTYDGAAPSASVTIEEDPDCPSPPAYAAYSGAAAASCATAGNDLCCTFSPALENGRAYRLTVPSGPGTAAVELRGLLGDVNSDGLVNATDRSVVVGAWTGSGFTCATDLNADSATNATDRSLVVGAWTGGQNCAP